MTFSDASAWTFYPFDEPNTLGKISAITDRNGNSVEFDYGAGGLLTAIHDSLGREITVIYNADGFIDALQVEPSHMSIMIGTIPTAHSVI